MLGVSEPFWMHDAARRRWCVGLFVVGCLLPTCGVLGWIVWRMLPGYVQQEAACLERILGVSVRLEGLKHPRPGEAIYRGVLLTDPDSGQEVVRAERVHVRWSRPSVPSAACIGKVELSVQGLEIHTEGLGRLTAVVRRALAQPPHWPPYEIRIEAAEARLRTGQQLRNLSQLNGFLQPLEGGSQGRLSFRLSVGQTDRLIQMRFGRDHTQSPPISGLELAAEELPVPCALLTGVFPALARLGSTASVRGTVWIHEQGGQLRYRFQGQLAQVDLKTLLGEETGPFLSGLAQIELEDARIVGERLEEALGTIRAGPGTISRRLWESALRELGLSTGFHPSLDEQALAYEQLAAAFQIGPEGLWLRGICPVPAPGSILVNSHQLLLGEGESGGGAIPIAALVRTLVPPERIPGPLAVPATRQAERLLRMLPLPLGSQTTQIAPEGQSTQTPSLAETTSRPAAP